MAKDSANKGWIREISKSKNQKPSTPKPFTYSKPVTKPERINSMAINSRTREHKSVAQDKSTSFTKEQTIAKQSHKGKE